MSLAELKKLREKREKKKNEATHMLKGDYSLIPIHNSFKGLLKKEGRYLYKTLEDILLKHFEKKRKKVS